MLARVPVVVLFIQAMIGASIGLHTTLPLLVVAAVVVVAVSSAVIASTSAVSAARSAAIVVVVTSAGLLAGTAAARQYTHTVSALPSSDAIAVVEGIVVDDLPADEGRRLIVEVDGVVNGDNDPTPRAAAGTLDVHLFPTVDVHAGDRVRLRGRLQRAAPALSPATYDSALAARARDLHASVSVRDVDDIVVRARGQASLLVRVRQALRTRLLEQVPPRFAGLLLALLIGDVSLFEDEQNTAYRHVGAGHLLAVSGLQVTLLAVVLARVVGAVFLLLPGGRRRRSQVLAACVSVAGVWAFVGICGMPPSAVRAAVMATAVVVGTLRGRRVLLVDAIAAAGLLTVLVSPASVDDAGFLLSYAAVLALAATSVEGADVDDSTPLRATWAKARPALIASLTAGFATLPLSSWLFGQMAPAGLVANIVLVPVASMLQLPALLCGVVGAVFDAPVITWIGGEAALLLEALVFGFADILPGVRAIEPPGLVVAAAQMAAALLAGALFMAGRTRTGFATVATIVVVTVVSAWERPLLRVTFLPVGQGDGAVLEFPDGTVFVVDAGGRVPFDPRATDEGRAEALAEPGKRVVVPYLQRRGIEHVDVVVMSHPHPDHAGGLRAVVSSMSVGELWLAGDASRPGKLTAPLIAAVGIDKVKSTPALLGTHRYGDVIVEVLAPAPSEGTPTYPELHANDNSLVMRVCWKATCVLLPGDLEEQGEELLLSSSSASKVKAQVVKAGHHGSRTSSSPAFVAATGAAHVVLCTGRHNTFHFPNPVVVERWRQAGASVWDTARHGQVRFELDGEAVRVLPYRDGDI